MNPVLAAAGFKIRWLMRLLGQGGTAACSNLKHAAVQRNIQGRLINKELKMQTFYIGFDDLVDARLMAEVQKDYLLEFMKGVIEDGGSVIIEQRFSNTAPVTMDTLSSLDQLEEWQSGVD